jgi:hypothetical protein
VRCDRCGHENPDENYFCGHCGIHLRHPHGFEPEAAPYSPSLDAAGPDANPEFLDPFQADGNASAFAVNEDVLPTTHSVLPERHTATSRSVAPPSDEPGWTGMSEIEPLPSTPSNVRTEDTDDLAPRAVTAPSFLGLNDAAPEDHGLDYLYDGEPRRSYGRAVVAILLLAIFGVFLAYKWKQLPSWYSTIVASPNISPARTAQAQSGSTASGTAPSADKQAPAETESNQTASPSSANPDSHAVGTPANTAAVVPSPQSAPTDSGQKLAENEHSSPQQATAIPDQGTEMAADRGPGTQHKPGVTPEPEGTGMQEVQKTDTKESSPAGPDPAPGAAVHEKSRAHRDEVRPARDTGDQLVARGQAYLYGNGVPHSCSQALIYLRKGADLGNAEARSQLGAMYATGHCVPLDRARAYQWFSLAAEVANGRNVWIERNREMLWSKMTDAEKAHTRQAAY